MSSSTVDLHAVKAAQQQTWATGDYGRIAPTSVLMSELLCEAADLRAGARVLDVATGSGTVRSQVFRYPSAAHYVEWFRTWFGPTVRTFATLDQRDRDKLATEFEALAQRHNRADDCTLAFGSDYLEVVARVAHA